MSRLSIETSKFFLQHPIFRLDEFSSAFGIGKAEATIPNRIEQFLASGQLKLIFPGVYAVTPLGQNPATFIPDPLLVASRLSKDSVIGYHSAFEVLGFTNQAFNQFTYFTAGHRRTRQLGNQTFVALPPAKRLGGKWQSLGVETLRRQGLPIKVTGRERALVDCLNRPQYSGGFEELLNCVASLPSLDFALLENYLAALRSPTLYARVGFVLERFAEQFFLDKKLLARLERKLPKSPAYLLKRETGNLLARRWHLLVPPHLHRAEESPLR
jgi:predicted transcriptional regulator of viral defense system